MYESYSLAVAESSVKQNPENRLKITKSLWLGAVWEPRCRVPGLWADRVGVLVIQNKRLCPGVVGLPWWLNSKESTCSTEDAGSISGLGRSPGSRNDNLLHYSYLKNPMDREALQAMGSQRVRHNLDANTYTHTWPEQYWTPHLCDHQLQFCICKWYVTTETNRHSTLSLRCAVHM